MGPWSLRSLLVCLVLLLAAACGDDGGGSNAAEADGRSTSSVTASTSPDGRGDDPSGSEDDGVGDPEDDGDGGSASGSTGSGPDPTTEPTSRGATADARALSYAELHSRQQELVGERVTVVAKAFHLTRCPPPGTSGRAQPCVLSLYLVDPGRSSLLEHERDEAIPVAEGGEPVSCPDSGQASRACPGWEDGATYRVTADVEHQVLGGRTTQDVQVDVIEKHPSDGG